MILLQLINIGLISARQQGIDGIIVVAVLRRAVNQTLAQLLMGQPVKVIGQRGGKLLLTDNALFEDQFFHGGEAVAQVGDTDLKTGYPVIFSAALLDTLRAFNTVIYQR